MASEGSRPAPFGRSEYRRRLERTRGEMEERGLEGLLVSDPANMNYLTGYDAWSFYVPQCVVVPRTGDPVWVGREMDAPAARATTWLGDDRLRLYSDAHVQSSDGRHPSDFVAGVVSELGVADGRVGVEMDAYYYTARFHRGLREALPGAELVDATLLVNWLRIRKSDREVELMREAGRLAEEGMRRGVQAAAPGVRESEVAAAVYQGLVGGTDAFGGDYPAIVPLMPAGEHTNAPHLTWSDRRLQEGDPLIIELAGVRHRYHAPLARTVYLGDPPREAREAAGAMAEGLDAALEAVEPGVTCAEVERAWRETLARRGFEKASRLGYACGLGYPPDWGEHTASLRPGDETELEPGMTFHAIPGLWLGEFGVEISETFHVTERGAETLSSFPRRLLTP